MRLTFLTLQGLLEKAMGAVLVEEFRTGRGSDRMERSAIVFMDKNSGPRIRRESGGSSPWTKLALAFLPEGYPSSVTSDYLAFQTWDTLQGLSTYIRSMLSTQALLSGFGVGAATATAIGATFQWFLRDLTGMLGGIIFTLYQGSNLDNRAKQWRLAADFMNDIGMLMDLISPLFPSAFMLLLCLGSAARAVTGVASGATRAALTQHFARQQNAADVSAKEGSQETAATLVGMVLGMLLARLAGGNIGAMWVCFLLLTAFHMYANYRAVRSLCLTSLNAERIGIVLQSFVTNEKVPSPKEASGQETLLPRLRNVRASKRSIVLGAKISSLHFEGGWEAFSSLISKYGSGKYLVISKEDSLQVILHLNATSKDFLRAYTHTLLLDNVLEGKTTSCNGSPEDFCIKWMELHYQAFLSILQESGWDVDHVLVSPAEWRADWTNAFEQKQK